jgi:hypothetical protein
LKIGRPQITITDEVAETPSILLMKRQAKEVIDKAYATFREWSLLTGCELVKTLEIRLAELNQIDRYPENFTDIADELGELFQKIGALQRLKAYGPLTADLKSGRIVALEKVRTTSERLKSIGEERSRQLFDELWVLKDMYVKEISGREQRSDESWYGARPHALELVGEIQDLCRVSYQLRRPF